MSARIPPQPQPSPIAANVGAALDTVQVDWQSLARATASCQACGLYAGRKNSTLQVDANFLPPQADWMVVGDPPEEDEDRTGRPFADQAGALLDNMLKAVHVRRGGAGAAGAYVSNVVKCRPPPGSNPQVGDLQQCSAYLAREIALVQPRVIVSMGRFANQLLLSEQPEVAGWPLGKLRGTVYRFRDTPVVVSYHPKVLLRASSDKAKAWADLCLAQLTSRRPSSAE